MSKHMKAISEAHFQLYLYKINNNAPTEEATALANTWWEYHCLALQLKKKEFNTRINKMWVQCNKEYTARYVSRRNTLQCSNLSDDRAILI